MDGAAFADFIEKAVEGASPCIYQSILYYSDAVRSAFASKERSGVYRKDFREK